MRAVQVTRFGGPEVMDVVDLPYLRPENGEQLSDTASSGVDLADARHRLSRSWVQYGASERCRCVGSNRAGGNAVRRSSISSWRARAQAAHDPVPR